MKSQDTISRLRGADGQNPASLADVGDDDVQLVEVLDLVEIGHGVHRDGDGLTGEGVGHLTTSPIDPLGEGVVVDVNVVFLEVKGHRGRVFQRKVLLETTTLS